MSYATQLTAGLNDLCARDECSFKDSCELLCQATGYKLSAVTNMCNTRYEVGRYRPSKRRHATITTFFRDHALPDVADRLDDAYDNESAYLKAIKKRDAAKDGTPETKPVWLEMPDDDV